MRIKSPSLSELHAFLTVCQLGSFRGAADRLCVTQAAVSRAVQRLEQRLECALLDRTGVRVHPTVRGQELQALVEVHVNGLENAVERFGGRLPAVARKLRLSVVPTLGTRWLMPRLAKFRMLHPDVEIEFRQFRYNEDFARDDVDLWVEVKRPTRSWPRGIRAIYLLGREFLPACTPEMARGLSQPSDLMHANLLRHTNFPENWALWLSRAAGVDQTPQLGQGFDLGSNLIVAACSGMGVIVIQPQLIEEELNSGQLVLPFKTSVNTNRGYYLCYRTAIAGNDAVDKFARWILAESRASEKRFGVKPSRI